MKSLVALLILFVIATSFHPVQTDDKPVFKFDRETNDFGKITQGTPVTVDFKFVNTGDQPLIITNIESPCGCTVPKYTSTPVKKGETGVVNVTYNAAAMGFFTKSVTVKSNARAPIKVLYITGEVVASATK